MNQNDRSPERDSPDVGYGPHKPEIKNEPDSIEQQSPYEIAAIFFALGLFIRLILSVLALRH
jgi:hypothetical protein